MADNPEKRLIINKAISILREGRTSSAGQFHSSITDAEFADYTTITGSGSQDKQRAVIWYEPTLILVLRDIKPDFAMEFADLGEEILINKEIAGWSYLFEFPDDYLDMVAQVAEGGRSIKVGQASKIFKYDHKVMVFDSYAHVVVGTDSQAWYCSTAHTAASANKPITGASYATYWTLYNTDSSFGATWVTGWAYKSSQDGKLLATNSYSNDNGNSAYIKYIPYVQAGINDKPQYYSEEFKQAFAVRLASALTKDLEKQTELLGRYARYEKPEVLRIQQMDKYIKPHITTFEARTIG